MWEVIVIFAMVIVAVTIVGMWLIRRNERSIREGVDQKMDDLADFGEVRRRSDEVMGEDLGTDQSWLDEQRLLDDD